MNFTKSEKLAIGKALRELVMADNKVSVGEMSYLLQMDEVAGITAKIYEESWSLRLNDAIRTLKNMTSDKKDVLVVMMMEMATSDYELAPEELEVMAAVFATAGIIIPKK